VLLCSALLAAAEPRLSRRALGAAVILSLGVALGLHGAPLAVAGLVITALALDPRDALHSECAAKLLWVFGAALALSWCGGLLLAAAAGTDRPVELWGVLALGLEARFLWGAALALSLLLGLVMLGAPPFHFWAADLLQGARPWLGPVALIALQWTGAAWLASRLEGIAAFPAGAEVAQEVLRIAAVAGLLAGALTLLVQRRPERRAGTLASLQGALVACSFAAGEPPGTEWLVRWGVQLAPALMGAATLARFLPVATRAAAPPGAMGRHHPFTLLAGLLSWFSLAGLPGTPGSLIWLDVGYRLLHAGLAGFFLALAGAWLVALTACIGQAREAFGIATTAETTATRVPLGARLVPWATAAALVWLGLVGGGR
jgi:NADH:ubiquinone oxidoreductase subunit 2 (subunit N)